MSKVSFSKLLFAVILLISCLACQEDEVKTADLPLFTFIGNNDNGIDFRNDLQEGPGSNILTYDYYQNGGGVSVGDINNDGLPDLFFTGNTADNKLFLNKGNLNFENISAKANIDSKLRWSTGSTFVDINNDGFLDIFVCNAGPKIGNYKLGNQIYINNKDLTFTERSDAYGFKDQSRSNQASFFDYDNDGDLDVFIANNSNYWEPTIKDALYKYNNLSKEEFAIESNRLYRNEGNNKFTDVTEESGVLKIGFGLGLSTCDFNKDGWIDIYVANDYWTPDFYFANKQGVFVEEIKAHTSHTSHFSMGVDAGDINNDELLDIMVLDMTPSDHIRNKTLMESMNPGRFFLLNNELNYQAQYMYNSLQLNNGAGLFSDVALFSGVAQTEWSWSTLFADLDLDGYQDNFITNGFLRDTKDNDWGKKVAILRKDNPRTLNSDWEQLQLAPSTPVSNYFFKNNKDNTFKDNTAEWGIHEKTFSNGAVYSDLDLDGDLDIVINNLNDYAYLYRNNSSNKHKKNYINFTFLDSSNKERHLNAKVSLHYADGIQYREILRTRGYLSSMETNAYFGIDQHKSIDKIVIQWLDGRRSEIKNPPINKTHKIDIEKSTFNGETNNNKPKQNFVNVAKNVAEEIFVHKENDYSDFETEILLPHSQSRLGPCIAVGDVDKNGLEDFYIGGAKGQAGVLYLQNNNTKFQRKAINAFKKDKGSEDLGALFFDADNDGDLDLYVSSGGGSEFKLGSNDLQDRLYKNDGKGNFTKSNDALPDTKTSNGKVKTFDFDKDGDLDLFVCGRTNPGKYPYPAKSYLLQNNEGKFVDVSTKYLGDMNQIGMVTDMLWTDINKDKNIDMLLVGEWMPITILINTDQKFVNKTAEYGMDDTQGWWYSIAAGDFDKDGDQDYIVGNLGLNNKFHPSKEKPFHVYSDDFDGNGSNDIVLSKNYKGKLVPVRGKECSTEQMPFISEKFPSYMSFATASMEDIFSEEKLNSSLHYEAKTFESVHVINNLNSFEIKALPHQAQVSPINAIVVEDLDGDGLLDLVIAGNNYDTEVETPAYDAGKGLFLKGASGGIFEAIPTSKSGLVLPYNLKDMKLLNFKFKGRDFPVMIGANNNGPIQFVGFKR